MRGMGNAEHRTRNSPVAYGRRVEVAPLEDGVVVEGSVIAFEFSAWDKSKMESYRVKGVGIVDELWVDEHPNLLRDRKAGSNGRGIGWAYYAELTDDEGHEHRVWLWRDRAQLCDETTAAFARSVGARPDDPYALF